MRVDYKAVSPAGMRALYDLERVVDDSGLEPLLLELVKIRASQLNRCAHCLEMHTKDARSLGESEDRTNLVAAWPEAPCFTARERAALAWCEALTLLPEVGAPDPVYREVSAVFSDQEVVALTLAVVAINGWNRLAVGLRAEVGGYQARGRRQESRANPRRDRSAP